MLTGLDFFVTNEAISQKSVKLLQIMSNYYIKKINEVVRKTEK